MMSSRTNALARPPRLFRTFRSVARAPGTAAISVSTYAARRPVQSNDDRIATTTCAAQDRGTPARNRRTLTVAIVKTCTRDKQRTCRRLPSISSGFSSVQVSRNIPTRRHGQLRHLESKRNEHNINASYGTHNNMPIIRTRIINNNIVDVVGRYIYYYNRLICYIVSTFI